jgi:excinuclease ABC subunit A
MKKKVDTDALIANQFAEKITFQGIRTHNLKNLDIELPKNKIITITGVSWSGKSSLAFDTIYKEGQFRYIESLSSYLRQFFNLGERPDIDHCTGLSPAIAIEQNKKTGNSRSSVGTLTEIDDYLRLLFAKIGEPYCYQCHKEIKPKTSEQIIKEIKDLYTNKKIYLLQESWSFETKTQLAEFVKKNRNRVEKWKWFTRYLIVNKPQIHEEISPTIANSLKRATKKVKTGGTSNLLEPIEYFYLETPNVPDVYFPLNIYGIYDRITIEEMKIPRIKEDIIKILNESKKFWIFCAETKDQIITRYTDKMYCAECNITYPEFTTQYFSPNRQEGACPNCLWLGEILQVDMDKILDPDSPYTKAILPRRDSNLGQGLLQKISQKYSIDPDKLRKDLPERFQHVVLFGDNELLRIQYSGKFMSINYKGIEEIIKDQYAKGLLTVDFQAMLDMRTCPECKGEKLKKESLNVFLPIKQKKSDQPIKYNIAHLQKIPLKDLIEILVEYQTKSEKDSTLVLRITTPLVDRCQTIQELWLGYLMLNRGIDTLSGWEIQRLRLAKQLGNKLTGIIYVLDEPTIGLDDKEIQKAIVSIKKLKAMGNTIVVVEHNEEFIKASDRVVEIWPWAGDFWWQLLFNWPYDDFLKSNTMTAQYITGKKKIYVDFEHHPSNKTIHIRKANKFNLKNINVDISLWSFTVITWPSGAGKTTLMYTTLYRFLDEKTKFIQSYIRLQLLKKGRNRQEILAAPVLHKDEYEHYENLAVQEFYKDLAVDTITGHEEVKNVIYVDQTSIGKTPRSCPATFIGTFDNIRQLYSGTTESKYLGFNASHFSFNSNKGACTACDGYGYKKIELQFLPDTYIPCDLCKGKRYKHEILDIKRKGKNISEVLEMYVDDALDFFKEIDSIREELDLMQRIGLGYIKLWQPAHTLSWGESQRIKLVKHLLKTYKGHSMYFLDEPTVGLHMADIEKLLKVIREFLNKGDTILMIEHDQNIIKYADKIIHLDEGKLIKH